MFNLEDLAFITYDFYINKLNSPKMYKIIEDYFMKQEYNEEDLN